MKVNMIGRNWKTRAWTWVGRRRVQLLLQIHGHAHDQRPDADVEEVQDLPARAREKAEAGQDSRRIWRAQIP